MRYVRNIIPFDEKAFLLYLRSAEKLNVTLSFLCPFRNNREKSWEKLLRILTLCVILILLFKGSHLISFTYCSCLAFRPFFYGFFPGVSYRAVSSCALIKYWLLDYFFRFLLTHYGDFTCFHGKDFSEAC